MSNTINNTKTNTKTNTIIANNKAVNKPVNTPANTPVNTPANSSINNKSTNKLPTVNNTPKLNVNKNKNINNNKNEALITNTIDAYQKNVSNVSNNIQQNNNIQTTKEEIVEYGNVITNNYLLLLAVSSAVIICIIIYFLSETFRVGRTLDRMLSYQGFQRIGSIDYMRLGDLRLGDMYVSSSYNAAHSGYQMYDYTSSKMVLAVLQSGVRYLEFNVFNSTFGPKAFPVVSMGYKKGEWKMMISDTPLETIFEIIANNAFKVNDGAEGVYNPDDPVFIGLNLNTNSNLSCLNLIAFLITKYFRDRLLPNDYSFQNSDNMGDIKLVELMGKVVFFASDGFQGSGLEEIINYSWDNIDSNANHKMQRIHYSTLDAPEFNETQLKNYNKTGLTIVVPHMEGDFLNTNYDPSKAFELGCQFVAMEFQYIDTNMNMYITRFKNTALILKDRSLQKRSASTTSSASSSAVSNFEDVDEEQDLETPSREDSANDEEQDLDNEDNEDNN